MYRAKAIRSLALVNRGERDLEFGKEGGGRGLVLGEEEGERD